MCESRFRTGRPTTANFFRIPPTAPGRRSLANVDSETLVAVGQRGLRQPQPSKIVIDPDAAFLRSECDMVVWMGQAAWSDWGDPRNWEGNLG